MIKAKVDLRSNMVECHHIKCFRHRVFRI